MELPFLISQPQLYLYTFASLNSDDEHGKDVYLQVNTVIVCIAFSSKPNFANSK